MSEKKCNKCGETKPLEAFYTRKHKSYPDGRINSCKKCEQAIGKRNQQNWTEEQKQQNRDRCKEYRESHKEEIADRMYRWRQENADRERALSNEYKKTHKEEIREHAKGRYQNDARYRITVNYRNRLNDAIREQHAIKSDKSLVLLGCTTDQLIAYIESLWEPNMTWDNRGRGNGKWELDHVRPCCSFDLTKPEDQAICFHYSNLRPMWYVDHLKKSRIDTIECRKRRPV